MASGRCLRRGCLQGLIAGCAMQLQVQQDSLCTAFPRHNIIELGKSSTSHADAAGAQLLLFSNPLLQAQDNIVELNKCNTFHADAAYVQLLLFSNPLLQAQDNMNKQEQHHRVHLLSLPNPLLLFIPIPQAQDNIIELNKSRLRALEELKAARAKIAELGAPFLCAALRSVAGLSHLAILGCGRASWRASIPGWLHLAVLHLAVLHLAVLHLAVLHLAVLHLAVLHGMLWSAWPCFSSAQRL